MLPGVGGPEKSNSRKMFFFLVKYLKKQVIMDRKSEPQELEVTNDIASVVNKQRE